MSNNLIAIRMTTIKKINKIISVDKDVKKCELLYTVGKYVKWCGHYRKYYDKFSKN